MSDSRLKVSDLGEIRLLQELILDDVTGLEYEKSDDCTRIQPSERGFLWSIDPCPTPVAKWFGLDAPEVWGAYTATINLSDIAASGGSPIGMLVSIEMPDDTPLDFVKGFQKGLCSTLNEAGAKLLGGNVKSSTEFSATGSILGKRGINNITRHIEHQKNIVYVIGESGLFWCSVIGNHYGWTNVTSQTRNILDRSLCYPKAQTAAGLVIGNLPFNIACMDCSDGLANALYQLAQSSSLDITLLESSSFGLAKECVSLLERNNISVENACYQFGDWQLLCLVPEQKADEFESSMSGCEIRKIGFTEEGSGLVGLNNGRLLSNESLNQNFSGGYNSIKELEDLVATFMRTPLFK